MILTRTEAINRAKQGDVKAMEALVQYFASRGDYAEARKWRARANAAEQRMQNPVRRQKKSRGWIPAVAMILGFILVFGVFGQMDSARSSGGARSASPASGSDAYAWSGESEPQSVSAGTRRTTVDPFEGIYYGQSRDEVLGLLGEPDSMRRPTNQTGNTDVYDTYYHVNCDGFSGTLQVYYDGYFAYGELTVKAAEFYISVNTEEEHNQVRAIEEELVRFYSSKYGEPYSCGGDQTRWSRGYRYTSKVNETIVLYIDSVRNHEKPIALWLVH